MASTLARKKKYIVPFSSVAAPAVEEPEAGSGDLDLDLEREVFVRFGPFFVDVLVGGALRFGGGECLALRVVTILCRGGGEAS